ncbi:MAG: hypothetical protein ROD09_08205 [Candidatus Sedimenticola sp. (ex Thyasira tokunagai)]
MLPQKLNLPKDQRRLLKLYKALAAEERETLLAFAEFLLQRGGEQVEATTIKVEVKKIPRPQGESVVAGIKRLTACYPMLDRSALLTETSSLMTAHIMHGRPASDVIDELETLFVRHYEEHIKGQS